MVRRLESDVGQLARAKWASSGLKDDHARALKLRALNPEETYELNPGFHKVPALLIPYFDIHGKVTKFYRIRYLAPLPGFAGAVKKPQRYAQPQGTLNEVYFPPLLKAKWKDIVADPDVPLYITEGELKAATGCVCGLATIGLGGVDVWRSSKRGIELLSALADINWEGRVVTIVYDSDAASNENVVRAQRQLARELLNRGAAPCIASLPPTAEGAKQGLDDFVVANGAEALDELLLDSPEFSEAEALWGLNEEVVYIKDPGLVVVRDTGQKMSPGNFVQHIYSNRHYLEQKTTKQGVKTERKPLAPRWMTWERRFELGRITYAPGKPQMHDKLWNTWPGWGKEPKKGDIGPWKWLLSYLFQGEPLEVRRWFEQWCAYPIQNPGTKLFTSVVLWGVKHGTGKTLAAYTLMRIYGKNAIEIKDKDLHGDFNEWAENKQFIYGDEVTGNDGGFAKRGVADALKGLITQESLRVNAKFMPTYVVPDCCNYYFTSNHPDAFFLEDNDRRYFIHEVDQAPAEQKLYDQYDTWLRGDGPAALFHHLLNVDLEGFHPKAPALVTRSKRAMIMDNKSDIGLWVTHLKEDPATTLRPLGDAMARGADLLTASHLLRAHDPENSGKVKVNGLARELKRAGFAQANGGNPVRTATSGQQRLYIMRNHEKWGKASVKELAAHFDSLFTQKKL